MAKMQDRWPDLCKLVEHDDGLPTRDAGPWTEDKLYFWNRYIDITTQSMVEHPKWPEGLVYVDLFAGPGVCEVKSPRKRFPGSPIIAAHARKAFRSILACEMDELNAAALETRLAKSPAAGRFQVFRGDCNQRIKELSRAIPSGTLTLAFIDPEGLHVWFETIRVLADSGRVDLLILLADRMDIVRNVDRYFAQQSSNLDRMFGAHSSWRKEWAGLQNRTPEKICKLFTEEYQRQLGRLGYQKFGDMQMQSARGPLYRLVFASKHPRGLEFWDKVTKKERGGQTKLFL